MYNCFLKHPMYMKSIGWKKTIHLFRDKSFSGYHTGTWHHPKRALLGSPDIAMGDERSSLRLEHLRNINPKVGWGPFASFQEECSMSPWYHCRVNIYIVSFWLRCMVNVYSKSIHATPLKHQHHAFFSTQPLPGRKMRSPANAEGKPWDDWFL